MSCDSDDPVYEIAYAEAVRALSEQLALVEGIRTRAGLLLSAGAVTTSFLGAQALGRAGLGALAWMALAGFCGTAVLCLVVLAYRSWELGCERISPFDCRAPSRLTSGG